MIEVVISFLDIWDISRYHCSSKLTRTTLSLVGCYILESSEVSILRWFSIKQPRGIVQRHPVCWACCSPVWSRFVAASRRVTVMSRCSQLSFRLTSQTSSPSLRSRPPGHDPLGCPRADSAVVSSPPAFGPGVTWQAPSMQGKGLCFCPPSWDILAIFWKDDLFTGRVLLYWPYLRNQS